MRLHGIAAITALATGLSMGSAQAAPQVLGLVATKAPVPLTCMGGLCEAEISAFCLQQDRPQPGTSTVYKAVKPSMVTLLITQRDGTVRKRPLGGLAVMTSARGQFAVRIEMREAIKNRLNAKHIAVVVGPLASAAPIPYEGDRNPLTMDEVDMAAGPLRKAARPLIDEEGHDYAAAARIINKMVNTLPPSGPVDRRTVGSVWRKTIGSMRASSRNSVSVRTAAQHYRWCRSIHDAGGHFRPCLQRAHDGTMSRVNLEYWKIVNAGS